MGFFNPYPNDIGDSFMRTQVSENLCFWVNELVIIHSPNLSVVNVILLFHSHTLWVSTHYKTVRLFYVNIHRWNNKEEVIETKIFERSLKLTLDRIVGFLEIPHPTTLVPNQLFLNTLETMKEDLELCLIG